MERKITALTVQKRNPNRVNVFLDGEFAFGLTRVVAAWLKTGETLSEAKIAALLTQETDEAAYQSGLNYLSYRPRSEAEARKKLAEKGYDDAVIGRVIERLIERGYLGDPAFANAWVENRSAFRPRSRRLLAYELRLKGVAEESIHSALDYVEDESILAYQAGIRYAHRLADLDWEQFRKRLAAFLGRRGFFYQTVEPVIQQVWSELQAERQKT